MSTIVRNFELLLDKYARSVRLNSSKELYVDSIPNELKQLFKDEGYFLRKKDKYSYEIFQEQDYHKEIKQGRCQPSGWS